MHREELAVQLVVYDEHVDILVPYWYKDERAEQIFSQRTAYARVIREVAGFFVYDPQINIAFDPEQTEVCGQSEYEKVVDELPKLVRQAAPKDTKPWWKLW